MFFYFQELFQGVKAAKHFHAGIALLRQLLFATLDMTLHSSYDPLGSKTPFLLQAELSADFAVIPPLDDDRFMCSFGHIFGGGYAAGYYSYIWAEVMSADAFAAFEEAGLDNDAAVSLRVWVCACCAAWGDFHLVCIEVGSTKLLFLLFS